MPAAHTAHSLHSGSLVAALLLALVPWLPLPLHAQQVCAGVAAEPVLQIVNAVRARGLRCGGQGPLVEAGVLGWTAHQQADWLARHNSWCTWAHAANRWPPVWPPRATASPASARAWPRGRTGYSARCAPGSSALRTAAR